MTPQELAILHREIERDRLLDAHMAAALASFTRDLDHRDNAHARARAHLRRATKHRKAYQRLERIRP